MASTWPRLGEVITVFEETGFFCDTLERVREPTFDTYDEFLELLPTMRRSDTALIGIDDEQWARGIAKIRQARDRKEPSWLLGLDLLVLRQRLRIGPKRDNRRRDTGAQSEQID